MPHREDGFAFDEIDDFFPSVSNSCVVHADRIIVEYHFTP